MKGNDATHALARLRRRAGAILAAAALLGFPAAAQAVRVFHAAAGRGQYLTVEVSRDGATITSGRMRERCRPGGRHQLVEPNFLSPAPIPVGDSGRFAKTLHGHGAKTRYRGFVNGGTVIVKVIDSPDHKCDGGTQRFEARLIK